MAKKKSLGSTPIGFSRLGSSSYDFIRELGKSGYSQNRNIEEKDPSVEHSPDKEKDGSQANPVNAGKQEKSGGNDNSDDEKKKIVSYYLERGLIKRLKRLADDQGFYYSAVVSSAIESWIDQHGY